MCMGIRVAGGGGGEGAGALRGPNFASALRAMRGRCSALRTCIQISVKKFYFVGPPKFCKTFRKTLVWATRQLLTTVISVIGSRCEVN